MKFIKSNPHPTGKKIGDCVIRSIAIAENKKWDDIYQALCKVGFEVKDLPNTRAVYEKYLISNGWKKQPMPRHPSGKRMKLSEFADTKSKGLFIASVVKHLTVIENNILLDTWDCGHKCVGNYFTR